MSVDTALCPVCSLSFTVTRYGRKIACPGCGELLDIQPDDPPNEGLSEADWKRAIHGRIEWLTDAAGELREDGANVHVVIRIEEELGRLKKFAKEKERLPG